MSSSSVCPHCRSSADDPAAPSGGLCPACGGAPGSGAIGLASGEAREFGHEASDDGVRLEDGSTACPVAFGPYRVIALIGKGGMGLVYHAIHEETREEVAVKTVRVRKRGMLHRIRREIHALARTEHPGLIRIIETGQSEGLPWYAMELVRGRSLHDLMHDLQGADPRPEGREPPISSGRDTRIDFILASGLLDDMSAFVSVDGTNETVGPDVPLLRPSVVETVDEGQPPSDPSTQVAPEVFLVGPPRAPDGEDDIPTVVRKVERTPPGPIPEGERRDFLVLVAKLCEALAYLHGEGIVHRDIKPQNVIVRPDGTPVLLDFGLASYFGAGGRESLEVGGKVEGTPEYMSPEQIRGEYVDARADLYAVGCILYEGLTGRVPFRGRNPGGTLRAHLKGQPTRPRDLRDDIPEALDSLILRLLARKAGDRLGYARDIIAALAAFGCVEPDSGANARRATTSTGRASSAGGRPWPSSRATSGGSWPGRAIACSSGARPGSARRVSSWNWPASSTRPA